MSLETWIIDLVDSLREKFVWQGYSNWFDWFDFTLAALTMMRQYPAHRPRGWRRMSECELCTVILTVAHLSDTSPQSDTLNFSLNCYSIPINFDIPYLVHPFNTMHHFLGWESCCIMKRRNLWFVTACRLMSCRSFNPRVLVAES
jgi:hypothetical protein